MKAYRYTESGLDNVIIEGAHVLVDDAGESCVTISNVNGLHRAIAQGIVLRRSAMIGRELRFLRTEMGMTQAELAAIVHREPLAISRWERAEVEIDSNAETLIRLYATERLGLVTRSGRRGRRLVHSNRPNAAVGDRRFRSRQLPAETRRLSGQAAFRLGQGQ